MKKSKPYLMTMNSIVQLMSNNDWWDRFEINNIVVHSRMENELQRAAKATRKSELKRKRLEKENESLKGI